VRVGDTISVAMKRVLAARTPEQREAWLRVLSVAQTIRQEREKNERIARGELHVDKRHFEQKVRVISRAHDRPTTVDVGYGC
jgi:hypothetical protein